MKFSDLIPGDTYNTKTGCYTKLSDNEAIVIGSSLYETGDLILVVDIDIEVIPISISNKDETCIK